MKVAVFALVFAFCAASVLADLTKTINGKKFLATKKSLRWSQAQDYCKHEGLKLFIPTMKDSAAKEFLNCMGRSGFFKDKYRFWRVGGQKVDTCGEKIETRQHVKCPVLESQHFSVWGSSFKSHTFYCAAPMPFICSNHCEGTKTTTAKPKIATAPTTAPPKTQPPVSTITTVTTASPKPTTTTQPTIVMSQTTAPPKTQPPVPTTTCTCTTTAGPKPTPTTAGAGGGGCADKYPDCSGLGQRVCAGLLNWAQDHCAAFCGLCKVTPCVDVMNCARYGDTVCSSASLSPWVDVNCRSFCQRC